MRIQSSATARFRGALPGLPVLLGLLGVVGFSGTLPATRAALPAFGPVQVGLGRAVLAAAVAGTALWIARAPVPDRSDARRLALVALGCVVGFPVFATLALRDVGAAHGAVLVGLIPIATAAVAVLRAGERPRPAFWLASAAGAVGVLGFAAVQGAGAPRLADLLLLAAVAACAVGYAEGGVLARRMPGWQVISWALLLALPALLPVCAVALAVDPPRVVDGSALLGLAYVSAVSMFGAFVVWYRGLALGGVARIGQLQLVQPVLTVAWAALLLGEPVDGAIAAAAAGVLALTAVTQRTRVPAAAPRPGAPEPAAGPVAEPAPEPAGAAAVPVAGPAERRTA